MEYIRVLISWPVAALVIAILLLRNFKGEFSDWIRYLAIRRGDIEVYSKQPPVSPSEERVNDDRLPSLETANEQLEGQEFAEPLPEAASAREKFLLKTASYKNREALYWEFNYLNYFLVQFTKKVLAWLAREAAPISTMQFHTRWIPYIFNQTERLNILNALQSHQLIKIENEVIEVTSKGREYVNWGNLGSLLLAQPTG